MHIALNVQTDINMTAWLDVMLYTVQEDGYRKIPLDFIRWVSPLWHLNSRIDSKLLRLLGSHMGYNLACEIEKYLTEFEIAKHVSFIIHPASMPQTNGYYSYWCLCLITPATTTHWQRLSKSDWRERVYSRIANIVYGVLLTYWTWWCRQVVSLSYCCPA